jgi:hypothetical protein
VWGYSDDKIESPVSASHFLEFWYLRSWARVMRCRSYCYDFDRPFSEEESGLGSSAGAQRQADEW